MESRLSVISVALTVALLLIHTSNAAPANEPSWPQFRGPGGLGIAPDSQTYPAKLDVSRNLLWKTEVPKGHSSPCIWADKIFITASSGNRLETICIDRRNGEIKWRKSVEPETLERISGSNSHASPTPVCDGKRVYVHFGSFGLLAYDMNGNEVWKKPLPLSNVVHGSASSPVLANDMVIIHRDPDGPNYGGSRTEGEYVLAVNQDTGETVWRQQRRMDSPGWSTPVLWKHGDEQELVVLGGGHVISYELKDGRKRWWFDNLPTMIGAALTPVYAEDTLFVPAAVGRSGDPVNPVELPDFDELLEMYDGNQDHRLIQAEIPEDMSLIYRRGPESAGVKSSFSQLDTDKDGAISETEWNKVVTDIKKIPPRQMDVLVAIRAGGKDHVDQSHVRWRAYEGIGQVPSPLFYQGRIYLVKHGGNVTCYDAKTGDKIYGDRVGPRVYYFASPVAADKKIYFCSSNGMIIVVQAGDSLKILTQNKIAGRIYATPALVDGNIYLRTDKTMYAFTRARDDSDRTPPDTVATAEDSQPKTLYKAAADGNLELVKSLISGGADVNTQNEWGWTPLYVAAALGNGEMVNLLIAEGADVKAPNSQGETPLQLAVRNGHRDIVTLLIEKGADVRTAAANGMTLLHTAAEQGQIDLVTLLIDKGADVNANAKTWAGTPLHQAAGGGHLEIVQLLIANGADVNSRNNYNGTPLHWAAARGYRDIVELLLAKGSDLTTQNGGGRTAAGFAQENGHTEIVELLHKYASQSGDAKEIMTIHDYAAAGDIEQVRSLISKGINANTKSQNGMTALHLASANGHKDITELLIQQGVDVNGGPQTPLILACQRGNNEIAELLIANGADINTKNSRGQTPLHFLARDGYTNTMERLIAKGADVNAADRWVWTPLHYACWRNQKEAIELLLTKGADVNAREGEGKTPLEVAEGAGNAEIVELLKKHGAEE